MKYGHFWFNPPPPNGNKKASKYVNQPMGDIPVNMFICYIVLFHNSKKFLKTKMKKSF